MELLLQEMDQAGIRCGAIIGRQSGEPVGVIPNDEIADTIARYPGRFVGFAGIDTSQAAEIALAEIERCSRIPGFVGVAIEPCASRIPMLADDRRLYPIYEACQRREIPVCISLSNLLCHTAGSPYSHNSPVPLYQVAIDFPKLDIIVAHGAWPWVRELLGIAFVCSNIWVSPDLFMVGVNMPGADEYVKAANMYLSERTLFGTNYPTRPLVESVQAFAEWTFAPGVKEKVLYKNALRVMKMDDAAPN
jgi:predicted TIM-barrel fold metal-dependent hydrolase